MAVDIRVRLNSRLILPGIFFGLIFLFYTYPMGLSDFWWHMNTGRWIWETMSIPHLDPFTYSYAQDDDIRRVVILKAYYLGQVSFYFIYSLLGIWGLLIYKALLLTLPLWILWRFLCFKGVAPLVGLILISLLPIFLYRFDELRAVIFSFIGAIAVLFLIEKVLEKLRRDQPLGSYFFALPTTMLLWANLHRGFLIGWVLLGTYLMFEAIKYFRQRGGLSIQAFKIFTFISLLSILISLLNPNGIYPVIANFVELDGPFMNVIDEYFPLWRYSSLYQSPMIFFGSGVIALFAGVYMLRAGKRLEPTHLFLLVGFVYEGLSTFRFSYFLVIMSLAVAAQYYQSHSQRLLQQFPKQVFSVAILSITVLTYFDLQRTALINGPWERAYYPSAATWFILDKRPPANIFNAFEYGGYLSWKFYPSYKIFIDQRNLDYGVYEEYEKAKSGTYQAVFKKYDVNTVIFYLKQPVLNRPPAIVRKLLQDNNWQVVYLDPVSIVFVRRTMNRGLPILDKIQIKTFLNSSVPLKLQ